MDISFVRTEGQPDRVYVQRTDQSEVSWAFPTYGNFIPHDLLHLVVETAFGLKAGFWGKVDSGLDAGRINELADRVGGKNKYAAFGSDQFDLLTSEFLAGLRWSDLSVPAGEISNSIVSSFPHLAPVTETKVGLVRDTIDRLCLIWAGLKPKGTLRAQFDPNKLSQSFDTLGSL